MKIKVSLITPSGVFEILEEWENFQAASNNYQSFAANHSKGGEGSHRIINDEGHFIIPRSVMAQSYFKLEYPKETTEESESNETI